MGYFLFDYWGNTDAKKTFCKGFWWTDKETNVQKVLCLIGNRTHFCYSRQIPTTWQIGSHLIL